MSVDVQTPDSSSDMVDENVIDPLHEIIENLHEIVEITPDAAEQGYIMLLSGERDDDVALRVKEEALYRLAKLYVTGRHFDKVLALLQNATPFFAIIPKAKTAKIVRAVIEIVCEVSDANQVQITLCEQVVAWCISEKRSFLRQRVQSKLAALLFKNEQYVESFELVTKLIKELKKLDDKQLLVETHLVEARIQHALRNIPKAKAALTSSRTNANAIYVIPLLQAEIDHMSGVLCCEEGDYNTAYSYFLESFEGFANVNGTGKQGDPRAGVCLKHMMLCKVLQGSADEVPHISSKWGLKHSTAQLNGLVAIAVAAKERSLEKFDAASNKYSEELKSDVLVSHHLALLYDNMLDSNLLKIISPFSRVELSRVSELINLPQVAVEKKLSQMILDKKLKGTLDQGNGTLIVFDEVDLDGTYDHASNVIGNMELVVESLFKRAQNIT